jgi:hypothetical protein
MNKIFILPALILFSSCTQEKSNSTDNHKPIITVVENYHKLLASGDYDEAAKFATEKYNSIKKLEKSLLTGASTYKKNIKNIFVDKIHNDVAIVNCIFETPFAEYGNKLILRNQDGEWKLAGIFGEK